MYLTSSARLAFLALALTAFAASAQPEGEVLLRVRVSHVEYTDYYPADDCPTNDCIVFYTWFRYQARVIEVERGLYNEKLRLRICSTLTTRGPLAIGMCCLSLVGKACERLWELSTA